MGLEYRNKPWFASTHSTAAGVILEHNPSIGSFGGQKLRLRGFYISGSTAVNVSTTPIKLIYGDSSAGVLSTIELCNDPGASMVGVSQLMGLEGRYFAIESTAAHADGGLSVAMWGD